MLIIDGHLDLAYNAVDFNRNLTLPVSEIRLLEGTPPPHNEGVATVSLPALRAAKVSIVQATIFANPENSPGAALPGCRTPEEAFQRAQIHVNYYRHLSETGEATIIHDQRVLDDILAQRCPLPGLSLLLEGATPIRALDDVETFYSRGVRAIGLTWKGNRFAGADREPGPLTEAGRELLGEMERLRIALDVSHLAEEAFWQALHCFNGKVMASHANCRTLVPGNRQLSDDMIRAIADRDGVIGIVFYNRFISKGWSAEAGKAAVSIGDLLSHVNHLAKLTGIRHIALGSDLDGGLGREDIPRELDSVEDLPLVADALSAAGYQQADIEAIMGENWLRMLRESSLS